LAYGRCHQPLWSAPLPTCSRPSARWLTSCEAPRCRRPGDARATTRSARTSCAVKREDEMPAGWVHQRRFEPGPVPLNDLRRRLTVGSNSAASNSKHTCDFDLAYAPAINRATGRLHRLLQLFSTRASWLLGPRIIRGGRLLRYVAGIRLDAAIPPARSDRHPGAGSQAVA